MTAVSPHAARPRRAARRRARPGRGAGRRRAPRRGPAASRAARVAGFAPPRRARLGGTAIAEALEADDELRERVGTQVAARRPRPRELATDGLDDARSRRRRRPGRAGGAGLAGASGGLGGARGSPRADRSPSAAGPPRVTAARPSGSREQLAQAEQALRELRQRTRAQVEESRPRTPTLRRKLGESRAPSAAAGRPPRPRGRASEEARRRGPARSRPARTRSCAGCAPGSPSSRPRSRPAAVRARVGARRGDHARAAAARHACSTPPPGCAASWRCRRSRARRPTGVEARLAEHGSRAPPAQASWPSDDPALLEQLLALPRARLVVDGYNVTKTAWPTLAAGGPARPAARRAGAAGGAQRRGDDGGLRRGRGLGAHRRSPAPRGVQGRSSARAGVIADDVIRELVAAEPPGRRWWWSSQRPGGRRATSSGRCPRRRRRRAASGLLG